MRGTVALSMLSWKGKKETKIFDPGVQGLRASVQEDKWQEQHSLIKLIKEIVWNVIVAIAIIYLQMVYPAGPSLS